MTKVELTEKLTEEEFNRLLDALQYAERNAVTADESDTMRKLTDTMVGMARSPPEETKS